MNHMGEVMDLLNAELFRAGEKLADLDLGVAAEVPLPDQRILGYCRIDKSWTLYVREDYDGAARQELCTCNRKIRIEAAHRLTDLRAALHVSYEDQLQLAQAALAAAQAFNQDP